VVLFHSNAYSQGISNKKVLILNSYSPDYIWTVEEQNGILTQLEDRSPSPVIFIENMDAKRFNTKSYLEDFSNFLMKKYSEQKFDAIVATDDPAFVFALNERNRLGDPAIFFCGVNTYSDDIKGHILSRVYGVKEEEDLGSTLSLMVKLFPKTKKILGLADKNDATYFKKQFENFFVSHKDILSEYFVSNDLDKIVNKINSEGKGTLVLNLISHSVDRYGDDLAGPVALKDIYNSVSIPMFGTFDYQLGYGIVGGMITSGLEQGKIVGTMAYDYLSENGVGWEKSKIVGSSGSNYYSFDENLLKKFNITKDKLPPDSKIINHHETFFERYFGAIIYFSIVAFLLLLIIGLLVTVLFQKRREYRKLSDSEKYFRLLLDNSTDMIFVVDLDGEILFENESMAMLFSDKNDIEAKNFLNFFENGKRGEFAELFERVIHTEYDSVFPFMFFIDTKSGTQIVFEGKAKKIPGKEEDFILLTISDITERYMTHRSLRNREEEYRILFNSINDIVLVLDSEYRIIKSNDEFSRLFGYKPDDLFSKPIIDFVYSEDREYAKSLLERMQDENIERMSFEIRAFDINNSVKTLDVKVSSIFKDSKRLNFVVCRDITMRKKTEEAFLQKQRELNILLDSLPGYIYYKNNDGIYVFVNNNFCNLLGKDRKQIIGHTDYEIYSEEEAKKNLELDRSAIKLGMPHFQESVLRKSNGDTINVLVQKVPILDEKRNLQGLISLNYDVTELKTAHDLVKKSEEKYLELINLLKDVVFELDYSGRFSFISDRIFEYTNIKPKEFLNKFFVDFSSPLEKEKLTLLFMSILRGEKKSSVFEMTIKNDKEEYIKFEMTIVAKYVGKVFKGAMGNLRKI
jgi:PAS domain S-box-containing protein